MNRSQRTKIGGRSAEALLYPIAAFLLAGGLTKTSAQRSFAAALSRAQETNGRRIEHIGHPASYADLISVWTHDARFLDHRGQPRPLLANEFRTLVRAAAPRLDWKIALSVLKRYGNVRSTKGRYALIRPFFFTSSRSSMAFEPMAYFLSDASSTLGRILNRTKSTSAPELFWRKVETTGLSKRAVVAFTKFVADRSLEFLEELDDWLETHRSSDRKVRGHRARRVGIGLFSIYSKPEVIVPTRSTAL
ncbi:MAG TPA: DUF6502 family protein [Candidatus Paceibacterota bacterium]|nr:DUF6502 family protein [Candidatus Paceibacterota bacterium]